MPRVLPNPPGASEVRPLGLVPDRTRTQRTNDKDTRKLPNEETQQLTVDRDA